MDDFDGQFPYPRFLKVPFIFVPDGTPGGSELAQFKKDYPGWVTFRATFTPRPPAALEPEPPPEAEPPLWQEAEAEPWDWGEPALWEQPDPDTRPWPKHLSQVPPATTRPTPWHSGGHDLPAAAPPASRAGEEPDAPQLTGMDLIMGAMTPDELSALLKKSERYRKRYEWNRAQRAAGVVGAAQEMLDRSATGAAGPLTKALDPGAGVGSPQQASYDNAAYSQASPRIPTRLAEAAEGEMPGEPPLTPAEGSEPIPGPGGLPDVEAPETASGPGLEPPPEVPAAPPPARLRGAAPGEVRARGDAKGGFPEHETEVAPDRRIHILDGDDYGGGHRPGTGRPGKGEFPATWSDAKIIAEVESVANDPTLEHKPQPRGRIRIDGTRDGVEIRVITESDGVTIVTGYPTNLPRNMK